MVGSFFMSSRTWPNGLLRLGTLQGEGDGMVDGRIVLGVLVGWVCWFGCVVWVCWLVGWVCWLGVLVEEKMIFGLTLLHFSKKRVKQGPNCKGFVKINLILRVFC